mmetsp:Transcript_10992/g.20341  ORF Transcript_10992/g.20341 Transcript_10992/m.20341 type:complete len:136 (-) Transcript_10992:156-563(-)
MSASEAAKGGFGKSMTPIFRSFSEDLATKFYVNWLGFKVDWKHRFSNDSSSPLYFQVSRGDIKIHLSEHHGDACPGSSIKIDLEEGLDDYLSELQSREYPNYNPSIQDQPWGCREMSVTDPFGNRIVFFQDVEAK